MINQIFKLPFTRKLKLNESVDRNKISEEIKQISSDIERLEESNQSLNSMVNDLQFKISKNKKESERLFKKAEEQKNILLDLRTTENSILNEINFLEEEKKSFEEKYNIFLEGLDKNILKLDKSSKEIDFIKGETGLLIEKMSSLEEKVPEKNYDVENINDTIFGTVKSLKDIYGKMLNLEKKVKINYYKQKKQIEG
ncbi:MAG: hypothetical protein HQK78_16745 [Desulfobacterales bacterium]|nr:hypothetical protein [Desulfobacterales bacterium]